MTTADQFTSPLLEAPGLAHAFFTRRGGVSGGVYASLNGGVGSRDAADSVAANRARMALALGVASDHLADRGERGAGPGLGEELLQRLDLGVVFLVVLLFTF